MRRLGLRRKHQLRREATTDDEATEEEETILNEEESILNEEAESSGAAFVVPAADPEEVPQQLHRPISASALGRGCLSLPWLHLLLREGNCSLKDSSHSVKTHHCLF